MRVVCVCDHVTSVCVRARVRVSESVLFVFKNILLVAVKHSSVMKKCFIGFFFVFDGYLPLECFSAMAFTTKGTLC